MPAIRPMYEGVQDVDYKIVTRYNVKRKDIMVLDNLYVLMYEWIVEHGYAQRDSFFPEVYMFHKESAAGKEIWWRWRPKKWPLGEKNKLWRFDMNIDVHVLGLKDVEVVIGGKKYKANSGEVEVMFSSVLLKDPEKIIEKSPFGILKRILFYREWKQQFDMLERELYRESMQFRDAINTFLNIETFLPTKEWPEFWPKRVPEA